MSGVWASGGRVRGGRVRGALRRPHVAHAVRVAAVATVVIAVVVVVAAAALDAFLSRRVLWEVDQRLNERVVDVSHSADPLARTAPDDQGTDGAPVFLWWIPSRGAPRTVTTDTPALPPGGRASTSVPVSVGAGPVTYRLASLPLHGGWLVAGQDLAGATHIEGVLFTGELVMGPVVLLAVFVGSLVIGLQAAAPVEQARRRLLDFTADASHELRTPLTVIGAEIELARSAPGDATETLHHVARETRRLERIVEDLLWLARFDSAPPAPPDEPVDLGEVVASCTERFAAVAGSRGLHLEAVHLGDAPAWVEAAPEWVDRLAGTLLDNACRYTPSGGTVRVSAGVRGGRAVLVVEDGGPGIPPEERPRLFDRFRRAADRTADGTGGAGLGLAIADSVVRTTGGRWRVDGSTLGGALMEVSWRRGPSPGRPPSPVPVSTVDA
ncbi:MAG: sensor histidine kinase [Acidimicrobiales bacterium]